MFQITNQKSNTTVKTMLPCTSYIWYAAVTINAIVVAGMLDTVEICMSIRWQMEGPCSPCMSVPALIVQRSSPRLEE